MGIFSKQKVKPVVKDSTTKKMASNSHLTDGLAAKIRYLEQRLVALEQQTSVLRRDFNRVERKQYREVERESPQDSPSYKGDGDIFKLNLPGWK